MEQKTISAPDAATTLTLRARIAALEDALANQASEIALAEYQISRAYDYVAGLFDVVPSILMTIDHRGFIRRANAEATALIGCTEAELLGQPLRQILPDHDRIIPGLLTDTQRGTTRVETLMQPARGDPVPVLLSVGRQIVDIGDRATVVLSAVDLRERTRLEMELRHAQKLESIGQLSAGIAHEINTPMQFINDNLGFIGSSVSSLMQLIDRAEGLSANGKTLDDMRETLAREAERLDYAFIRQRLPRAINRALEGVGRVSHIVDGMRVFSHPSRNPEPLNLNELVSNALTIARNEYKYVADLVVEAGQLPAVQGIRSDLGQVVINLVTNAAHAIAAQFNGTGERGHILVSTMFDERTRQARLVIEDNGTGVPEHLRHRIFDPFFTTKPVGQGTGQGLSISHSIVVDRHGGSIHCEPVMPHGTRFVISLPEQAASQSMQRG